MKVLLVKTSSLGDVIHTLPALTDVKSALPQIEVDWVVEENFAEIPTWHPAVKNVIPVALRRLRKQFPLGFFSDEFRAFIQQLRQTHYDYVLDAQGLIKSAVITRLAKGKRCGLNWHSAWEPLASLAYQTRVAVDPNQHAIDRVRQLFAGTFNYSIAQSFPDYGIKKTNLAPVTLTTPSNYLVFLHGTTWDSKHWPETYWVDLINLSGQNGLSVLLPWGNDTEKMRAERLAANKPFVTVLPKLNLSQIASLLVHAKGVVAVDTGLGHLAAALSVPTVSIYGPTNATLTGTRGANQKHLSANFPNCAPCLKAKCFYKDPSEVKPACYTHSTPEKVWQLLEVINS